MRVRQMTAPIAAEACPLCGSSNACAMAAGIGDLDQPCWCTTATFTQALLDRVPQGARGLACICATCATTAADSARREP